MRKPPRRYVHCLFMTPLVLSVRPPNLRRQNLKTLSPPWEPLCQSHRKCLLSTPISALILPRPNPKVNPHPRRDTSTPQPPTPTSLFLGPTPTPPDRIFAAHCMSLQAKRGNPQIPNWEPTTDNFSLTAKGVKARRGDETA
jgi:hypothetical protein